MSKIEIKKITRKDIEKLQIIGIQTFQETFFKSNSEENLKSYLNKAFTSEKLIAELTDKNSEFYFATIDKKEIGYLKINFGESQTELKDNKALEIERIYVFKEYHGKNVGQLLCDKAILVAQQNGLEYVWLGVWEKNSRAINFYKKNGFIEFDKHIFKLGNDEQTDIMLRLNL